MIPYEYEECKYKVIISHSLLFKCSNTMYWIVSQHSDTFHDFLCWAVSPLNCKDILQIGWNFPLKLWVKPNAVELMSLCVCFAEPCDCWYLHRTSSPGYRCQVCPQWLLHRLRRWEFLLTPMSPRCGWSDEMCLVPNLSSLVVSSANHYRDISLRNTEITEGYNKQTGLLPVTDYQSQSYWQGDQGRCTAQTNIYIF